MLAKYKVLLDCRVDGKLLKAGDTVELDAKAATVSAGLRFKQLEAMAPEAKPEGETDPDAEPEYTPDPNAKEGKQHRHNMDQNARAAKPLRQDTDGTHKAEMHKHNMADLRKMAEKHGVEFQADTTKAELITAIMEKDGYAVE